MNEKWDYKIDGKQNGLIRLIIIFAVSVFFIVLTVDQFFGKGNKSMIVGFFFAAVAVSSLYIFIKLALRFFFFKVYIGEKGFYFQSNPFNGKYYEYGDIRDCFEELKTSRSGYSSGPSQTSYFYYFTFTDKSGKSTRFLFDKALYEHEFNELKERIFKVINS